MIVLGPRDGRKDSRPGWSRSRVLALGPARGRGPRTRMRTRIQHRDSSRERVLRRLPIRVVLVPRDSDLESRGTGFSTNQISNSRELARCKLTVEG